MKKTAERIQYVGVLCKFTLQTHLHPQDAGFPKCPRICTRVRGVISRGTWVLFEWPICFVHCDVRRRYFIWLLGVLYVVIKRTSYIESITVRPSFHGQRDRVSAPSKIIPARNLYSKSERLSFSCRVDWAWFERINLCSRQILIIPRKTKICATYSGPELPSGPPGFRRF